jgi:hypothetical protein
LQVFTVPYTAQFHNPFAADKQMSYNDSRAEGTTAAVKAITDMNDRCPLTSYVIIGFSQGAVIGGDIASDIGNGRGPVDQDLVLGVTLIADGRRQTGIGQDVGTNPPGQGAEVTLHEIPMLSGLGLTMTGERPGGFGALTPHQSDLRAGRPDLRRTGGRLQHHQPAAHARSARRRRRAAGARAVRHAAVLERQRSVRDRVDTELGPRRDRQRAASGARLSVTRIW